MYKSAVSAVYCEFESCGLELRYFSYSYSFVAVCWQMSTRAVAVTMIRESAIMSLSVENATEVLTSFACFYLLIYYFGVFCWCCTLVWIVLKYFLISVCLCWWCSACGQPEFDHIISVIGLSRRHGWLSTWANVSSQWMGHRRSSSFWRWAYRPDLLRRPIYLLWQVTSSHSHATL